MIEFPDVSHHNWPLPLTGAVAVIAKGDQGSSMRDPEYQAYLAEATQLGIPFSGYHWVDTSDLDAQAADAVAAMGAVPMMLDMEAAGATVDRGVQLAGKIRARLGTVWGAYLPRWWWVDLGQPDLRPLVDAGLSLVSSDYSGPPDAGWAPYGGVRPVVWQFTNAHPFNGKNVDFNRFDGTVEQLRALWEGPTMSPEQAQQLTNIDWAVAQGAQNPAEPAPAGQQLLYWTGWVNTQLGNIQSGIAAIQAALAPGTPATPAAPTAQENADATVDELEQRLQA